MNRLADQCRSLLRSSPAAAVSYYPGAVETG